MNIWKTRHYTADHGGQPTANSKSLVQRQRRTDDQVSWAGNAAQEVGDEVCRGVCECLCMTVRMITWQLLHISAFHLVVWRKPRSPVAVKVIFRTVQGHSVRWWAVVSRVVRFHLWRLLVAAAAVLGNADTLNLVDTALFCLALEDFDSVDTLDMTRLFLYSNAASRLLDLQCCFWTFISERFCAKKTVSFI